MLKDVPVEKALKQLNYLSNKRYKSMLPPPQELVMPERNREFVTWFR